MRKIRKSVFETNSSSTHSICIAKESVDIPKSLHFGFGDFGWECRELYSTIEKAEYLYTALVSLNRMDDFNKIVLLLNESGVNVTSKVPTFKEGSYMDGDKQVKYTYADNAGYVDHVGELTPFLDAVCNDREMLLSYLFSNNSFIITGNDNDDYNVDICVNYDHHKFYKGN